MTTTDTLFSGALALRQPGRGEGYRVNVDAILLAAFAAGILCSRPRACDHAVDLGAGVGAVGLSLLHFGAITRVTMVEIDPDLATLARENAAANGWTSRITVTNRSVADADDDEPEADLVVCNPPYVPPGRGRPPAEPVRGAKHGSLDTFLDAARGRAGRRARACFVYPAIETTTLLEGLRDRGLEPKRLCAVHARATDPARVVLVEAVAGRPGGLLVEPPFVERTAEGPTAALAGLLRHPGAAVHAATMT